MTPTQGNPSHETRVSMEQGRLAENVPLVSLPRSKTDTHAPHEPKRRMVPSSVTTGSVWLRYSVQRAGRGSGESSTQV